MKAVKIIFLDIDGVLKRIQDRGINPKLIANIKELIEKTDAKIVVSSDWRYNGLDFVKKHLSEIQEHIIDLTPAISIINFEKDKGISTPRGLEIREWMDSYMSMDHYIKNYVIIDDSQDMLYTQRNNYVQVQQNIGFDDKCLEKALEILN